MADRADLITAVRLPTHAFRRIAGTDVTADLLLFRVREEGHDPTPRTRRFLETEELELEGGSLAVNGFFVDHPDHLLGRPQLTTGQFGQPVLHVIGHTDDLGAQITRTISPHITHATHTGYGLTATTHSGTTVDMTTITPQATPLPGTVTYQQDGTRLSFQIFSAHTGQWEPFKVSRGASPDEWRRLIDLRDTAVQLRQAYDSGAPDTIRSAQQRLHEQYDAYLEKYGPINRYVKQEATPPSASQQKAIYTRLVAQWRRTNDEARDAQPPAAIQEELREQAATPVIPDTRYRPHIGRLDRDPLFVQVMMLEVFDEDTQQATKAPIFTGNPARPAQPLRRADSVEDAVTLSLDRYGVIDPTLVADLTDMDTTRVETELVDRQLAFRDPENPDRFIQAARYLSGVVEDKLETARIAAVDDPRLIANVEALEKVQPERIEEGIDVRPGSQWLPIKYYQQFAAEKFGIPAHSITIDHRADRWTVSVNKRYWNYGGDADHTYGVVVAHNANNGRYNFAASAERVRNYHNQGVACTRNDGVVVSAPEMLEAVLNLSAPPMNWSKSWREKHPNSPLQHAEASTFAARKARHMRDEFSAWIMSEPARRKDVVDRYNRVFNSFVAATWDGSYRTMPGLGNNFKPYSYQLDAVERIVNEPTTLLNHAVGAGKTGTFFMGAAELKRLGKIRQPWVVVPNHLAEQITTEAQQWYPNARVLTAAGVKTPEERRLFIAQTTAQDWDFVIVPQSVFERVPMSRDTQIDYIQQQKMELRKELESSKDSTNMTSVKHIERSLAALENRVNKLLDKDRDLGMNFESTPCDYLVVDEAHMYKNLMRASAITDISHPGSQRASDLDMKLNFLRAKATENGLDPDTAPIATFATGTPLANNLAEIWVMQHYLRPDLLQRTHTDTVNGFAAQFTDQIDDVEVNASGSGLRKVTRTAQFINTGDLAVLCEPFMDVVTRDQITAHRPEKITGDSNRIIEFDVEEETRDFIADLAHRSTTRWDQKFPEAAPRIDNPLKIASDGRKATLHPALVNLDVPGHGARITAVTEHVVEQWRLHKDDHYLNRDGTPSKRRGGLQIIFCDQGTPKKDGRFSIYEEMKEAFVEQGMDPHRIEFVHDWDHDRAELFRRCREGHIDVVIGSTEKLGTGANIQDRAVALHHVDVPWRPADLEQREGRIIRQGNQNNQVEVFNYVARGTFDAVQWQTLYRKARFIAQFHTADRSLRQMDAIEDSAAEAAAHNKAVATGDHRYVDLMNLDKEVAELESRRMEWAAAEESTRLAKQGEGITIKNLRNFIDTSQKVLDQAEKWSALPTEQRTWTLPGGTETTDRAKAAHATSFQLKRMFDSRSRDINASVLTIAGIDFTASYSAAKSAVVVTPSTIPNAQKITFDHTAFDHRGGIPREQGKVTTKEYGVLTRLENRVHNLHKEVGLAISDLHAAEQRLAKMEARASTTFGQEDELDQKIKQRDALREELAKVDHSEQAQQVRRERDLRLQQHGRKPLWTLRLNPTEGYAENVEHTTVEDTIARAHRDDYLAQFHHGLITHDELATQLAHWAPAQQKSPPDKDAPTIPSGSRVDTSLFDTTVDTKLFDSICNTPMTLPTPTTATLPETVETDQKQWETTDMHRGNELE